MLTLFEQAIMDEVKASLGETSSLVITRSPGDISNPSVAFDFDGDTRIGRITCWSSGEVYQEIIDLVEGVNLLNRHTLIDNIDDFREPLKEFFAIFIS
jgi:hypothetical protein